MAQTDKQTDGHGDSMTESAHWGRFSKNLFKQSQNCLVAGWRRVKKLPNS